VGFNCCFVCGHWSCRSHVIRHPCRCPLKVTVLASIASDFTLACYWPWALPLAAPNGKLLETPGDVGRDNDIVPKSLRGVILWRFSVGDALTVDRIDGISHPDPFKFSRETAFLTPPSHLRLRYNQSRNFCFFGGKRGFRVLALRR
jgi:hypothetical protein